MIDIRQRWLDHLIALCKAGQKAHAWNRALELDQNEMLEGISGDLEREMKKK